MNTLVTDVTLSSEIETQQHAKCFAQRLLAHHALGLVIYLEGDLGAGKTTWVRAFLEGLGYVGRVKSPTYTLVEPYEGISANQVWHVFHFDLYRLNSPREWFDAGFDEYVRADSICLIEWPALAKGCVPAADIVCQFSYASEFSRHLTVTAYSAAAMTVVA